MRVGNSKFFFIILMMFASIGTTIRASEHNLFLSSIANTFCLIPTEDQKIIKSLFKDLFLNDLFAYSLFGDKPLSFSDICLDEYSSNDLLQLNLLQLICIDGYVRYHLKIFSEPSKLSKMNWEVWSKHRNKFSFNNYVLFEKKIINQKRIFILNKKSFTETVNRNIDLFKRNINPRITAERLIHQIELEEEKSLLEILNNNEGLLGILLGFGRHNSMLFQKREELSNTLGKNLKNPEIIQNKIRELDSKLQSLRIHDPYIIATINRVGFVADSCHWETIQLRNKYDELNRKITEIYSQENWFEQTLLQLTSNE